MNTGIKKPTATTTSLTPTREPESGSALTIANKDDYRIRRTDEHGITYVCFEEQSLFARNFDIFLEILYWSDYQTLMNLRQVARALYNLSMQRMNEYLSPLMCKVLISFRVGEMCGSEKVKFALACTSINLWADIRDLEDTTLLCDEFRKSDISLVFKINKNDELIAFNNFLLSPDLSDDQKLILSKIKDMDLSLLRAAILA